MLDAVVISNAIIGLDRMFASNDRVRYRFAHVTPDFSVDLTGVDLLVVPNGCDHVAMLSIEDTVRDFLARGGTLFCFDGWFTDWMPGNQWRMDNSKPSREVRYHVETDRHGLMDGVDMDELQFNHGISGWWSCGYIDTADGADVVLADTWNRPVIVLDEVTTPGRIVLTASGPLGDFAQSDEPAPSSSERYASDAASGQADDGDGYAAPLTLYRNMVSLVETGSPSASTQPAPAHV